MAPAPHRPDSAPARPALPARAGRGAAAIAALGRGFQAYARWLVDMSWARFTLLSVLLLILSGVLSALPPFSWTIAESVRPPRVVVAPGSTPGPDAGPDGPTRFEITVDGGGVRVQPLPTPRGTAGDASDAASQAAAGGSTAEPPAPRPGRPEDPDPVDDEVGPSKDEIRREIRESIESAVRDAATAGAEVSRPTVVRTRLGDDLPTVAVLLILTSALVKLAWKGRLRAEAQAAQAVGVAEDEALKRQLVEARMAAMQAQVEPHFLFNTLASIDHLIETDPRRASAMQKHLIALLRATMPATRDPNASAAGDLGRELALVRPYLEILGMRMEERLRAEIRVPDGLLSAAFPPMMIQGLVENAIRHGLEPKPEGGRLLVTAEVVDGDLAVSVSDTGLGFGRAATAGTGTGLANMRERLQLLYGDRGRLTVTAPAEGGTQVTIQLPYAPVGADRRRSA